ncbi:archaellin/type IV pilin N-terminal domain-containing protein [Nitrosopumilus ureiphilus]|uniref:Flagellin n=1 Tax=Nitrosopumilus ureiphilus TaxID=1470067 RepID=A0A7D5R6E6_9ARCH|nr:archaellin/type IV pilin N-terminal domain-containing protein [Nitrosopumilus ureiphilus]QLH06877.1 flagellin [Nitrosopumilus ureiphilus]
MKLQRKGTRHSHRGVIGVESAIVMIAFVIVAAALAFVVLNMGFTTTQKAKTTIISGLDEASSSMQIAGKVTGVGCTSSSSETACATTSKLNATSFPIKVTSGGDSVDLSLATTAVKYLSNSVEYDDIYSGPITAAEHRSLTIAFEQAVTDGLTGFSGAVNPVNGTVASQTAAIVYWSVQSNTNSILDQGEHAVLAIAYGSSDRPSSLDTIRAELIVATGASLTVERQVPVITTSVVDLG